MLQQEDIDKIVKEILSNDVLRKQLINTLFHATIHTSFIKDMIEELKSTKEELRNQFIKECKVLLKDARNANKKKLMIFIADHENEFDNQMQDLFSNQDIWSTTISAIKDHFYHKFMKKEVTISFGELLTSRNEEYDD